MTCCSRFLSFFPVVSLLLLHDPLAGQTAPPAWSRGVERIEISAEGDGLYTITAKAFAFNNSQIPDKPLDLSSAVEFFRNGDSLGVQSFTITGGYGCAGTAVLVSDCTSQSDECDLHIESDEMHEFVKYAGCCYWSGYPGDAFCACCVNYWPSISGIPLVEGDVIEARVDSLGGEPEEYVADDVVEAVFEQPAWNRHLADVVITAKQDGQYVVEVTGSFEFEVGAEEVINLGTTIQFFVNGALVDENKEPFTLDGKAICATTPIGTPCHGSDCPYECRASSIWSGNCTCRSVYTVSTTLKLQGADLLEVVTRPTNDAVKEIFRADDSIALEVKVGSAGFIRGDVNADGAIDVSDPIFDLNGLFGGGPLPSCLEAADANADGAHNIADAVYSLNFQFGGGPRILAPSPDCGAAGLSLGCESFPPCG